MFIKVNDNKLLNADTIYFATYDEDQSKLDLL